MGRLMWIVMEGRSTYTSRFFISQSAFNPTKHNAICITTVRTIATWDVLRGASVRQKTTRTGDSSYHVNSHIKTWIESLVS